MIAALLLSVIPVVAPTSAAPAPPAARAQSAAATGLVRDSAGGIVPGAIVVARTPAGAVQRTVTGPDGQFTITLPPPFEVTVSAVGFAETTESVAAAAAPLEIVLTPAGFSEQVTVTPTRGEQRLGDVPASVNVLTREDVRNSPAVVPDDLLRELPQFSLFRRSTSISAHPTSQGVSLRGIGPSGVSRSLVLLDGVPFNDAFGGWVYWTALPMEDTERIEVVDGSNSSLYGTYAMGGVINIMTRPPTPKTFDLRTQYGTRQSPRIDFRGSDAWGKVGASVNGSFFDTDGYPNTVEVNPAGQREAGPIDNNVAVTFKNLSAKVDYAPNERVHAFFRGGYFREERANGTRTTFGPGTENQNDTTWKFASGGVRLQLPDSSQLQATLFGDTKTFSGNFVAILDEERTRARVALNQRVPTNDFGGLVQWTRAFAGNHVVSAGTDFRWVDGDSIEDVMSFNDGLTPVTHRVSGGTQLSQGVFAQDVFAPRPDVTLTLSGRVDHWRNYDPHNVQTSLSTGVTTADSLPTGEDTVFSPRVGLLYRVNTQASVWGAVSSGFRAPTLNELYRQFRVGLVTTLANPELGPERLVGEELGLNLAPAPGLSIRTTWFDNHVKDPVSNTTIGNNLQQRQNLGRTRIWGLQSDVEYAFGSHWRVAGAYLFEQPKVTENDKDPSLVGRYLAQVPKHRGMLQVRYADPRYVNVFFDIEMTGRQFDDDKNVRTIPGLSEPGLPGYALVNFNVSRALSPNVDVFFGAENLLNEEYFVGTAPTLVGPPRLVTGGVRVSFQGR